jgi:hypothetical protein
MFLSDNHIAFSTVERTAFEFKYILEAFPPQKRVEPFYKPLLFSFLNAGLVRTGLFSIT